MRYSIESGLLGPGVRLTLAALFGLALIAVGELIRRKALPKAERKLRQENSQPGNRAQPPGASGARFGERHRESVRDYFEPRVRAGRCPPGLAKKNNGCMPPGQAKKWRKGYRLPSDVIYYDVPNSVSIRLGVPPSGYKYVRVAADILLIAVGTGMVIDAIEDLGGL